MKLLGSLTGRIRNAHPDHHAIARGMGWVTIFLLLSSLARAAREMMIAYRYGISGEVDGYLFVLNLVAWPIGVWFSILTVILVPLASRLRQDPAMSGELARFRAELLGFSLLLGGAALALAWTGLPLLMRSSLTGLAPETSAMAMRMVPAMALLVPLGVLVSLFSAWTLAAGRHTNTLLEGVPSAVVVLALLAFSTGGIEPLVWGTAAGFAVQLTSLAVPLARRGEMEAPLLRRSSNQWGAFWQGFGIMLVGQTLMSFADVTDQFFAGRLGSGAVATLGYSNRILTLILGVGAITVSRATMPVFSSIHASDSARLDRLVIQWAGLMFAFGLLALGVGWLLAPWAVSLFFERGAFNAADSVAVTEVFRYGLLQIPFYFSGMVFVSLLVSRQKYRVIGTIAVINCVVKITANLLLSKTLGLPGIAMATGVMYLGSMVLNGLASGVAFKYRSRRQQ